MPPLRDIEIIKKFRVAFEEHNSGGVYWKRVPTDWIRKNLDGYTPQAVNGLIQDHIAEGGDIIQIVERREEYCHLHKFHYDFEKIPILGRLIYIETVLSDSKMGPVVTVVSVHDDHQ
jgi:hypothetical protein